MKNPFLDKLDSSQVSTAAARPQSKLALFGGCDVRSHANWALHNERSRIVREPAPATQRSSVISICLYVPTSLSLLLSQVSRCNHVLRANVTGNYLLTFYSFSVLIQFEEMLHSTDLLLVLACTLGHLLGNGRFVIRKGNLTLNVIRFQSKLNQGNSVSRPCPETKQLTVLSLVGHKYRTVGQFTQNEIHGFIYHCKHGRWLNLLH